MTSAAPLSVVLSLFSQRKEGKKRAQRRSYLKGLQRLFPMFLRSYSRRSRPVLICSMSRMILILEEEEDRLRVEKFIIPNVTLVMCHVQCESDSIQIYENFFKVLKTVILSILSQLNHFIQRKGLTPAVKVIESDQGHLRLTFSFSCIFYMLFQYVKFYLSGISRSVISRK